MITLRHDTLSFTFPEIARQVRSTAERHIQRIAAELPSTGRRSELLAEIESNPRFSRLSPADQESARTKVRTWTPAHVEAYLRKLVLDLGGLNTDAFTGLTIKFQRTARLPDDGRPYPLPLGAGQLPLRSVDDFPETAPAAWMKKGGVLMPLAQSEALWVWFSSRYRFAVKIGAGKINALSGEPWSSDLRREPQNYVVAPGPPWGDNDEVLRCLVAMPLATGFPREESLIGKADTGGFQFQVVPMCAESYYRDEGAFLLPQTVQQFFSNLIFVLMISGELAEIHRRHEPSEPDRLAEDSMEPAPEVTARQEIDEDEYEFAEWDQTQTIRCVVHPCDSAVWRLITGTHPPHPPLTAKDYEEAGIPWFDDYRDEGKPLMENSSIIAGTHLQYGNTRRPGGDSGVPRHSMMCRPHSQGVQPSLGTL